MKRSTRTTSRTATATATATATVGQLALVRGGEGDAISTPDVDAAYAGDKNPGQWKGQN